MLKFRLTKVVLLKGSIYYYLEVLALNLIVLFVYLILNFIGSEFAFLAEIFYYCGVYPITVTIYLADSVLDRVKKRLKVTEESSDKTED